MLDEVTASLSDYCPIQSTDIRAYSNSGSLSNVYVDFDLHQVNGVARVSIDKAQIVLFSPHALDKEMISGLLLSVLNSLSRSSTEISFAGYVVQGSFHAELENTTPAIHTRRYVLSPSEDVGPTVGNSVTYYFGDEGCRTHSSITLDVSAEFPECVLVRASVGFEAEKIEMSQINRHAARHGKRLLALVGMESNS